MTDLDTLVSKARADIAAASDLAALDALRVGLLGKKGDRRKGVEVLRLIEPQAASAEIEAKADEIIAASSESASSGRF